eukprot:jgi/Botrbrau1/4674/Bobra.33_2s0038.2
MADDTGRAHSTLGALNAAARCALAYSALTVGISTEFSPLSWVITSFAIWVSFACAKTWARLNEWDKRQMIWGLASAAMLFGFIRNDPNFKGWGDIYYFCGTDMQYCEPSFSWNLRGWGKAAVMWSFVLSAALGLQKLAIQVCLDGLLPGEEVVTKESFISICWRLIPYWLNKWEQEWGAECSSMMFELPHFAVELLVVLPCVQIICARLKILAMPPGRGVNQQQNPVEGEEEEGADLAPCILKGTWQSGPAGAEQQYFVNRLRANMRVLLVVVGLAALAAFNSLSVPIRLEHQILIHPRTAMILNVAKTLPEVGQELGMMDSSMSMEHEYLRVLNCLDGCDRKPDMKTVLSQLRQHHKEITKMQGADHMELIPLVEVALAIMRLSCEKYFVLISVLAAYLLFRDDVPSAARWLIRVNHRISTLFQRVILYSFPAICWTYGAGTIFSLFVSVVFWGPVLQSLYESLRKHTTVVRPMGMEDATEEQIERMNNNCAVCWSEMGPPIPRTPMRLLGAGGVGLGTQRRDAGKSLPCGHAFHEACIKKWLAQCHGQGRLATCPMCNNVIELEVKYRLPFTWRTETQDNNAVPAVIPPLVAVDQQPANGAVPPQAAPFADDDSYANATTDTDDEGDVLEAESAKRPKLHVAEQLFRSMFPEPPDLDDEEVPTASLDRDLDIIMAAYDVDMTDLDADSDSSSDALKRAERTHICVMHCLSLCRGAAPSGSVFFCTCPLPVVHMLQALLCVSRAMA